MGDDSVDRVFAHALNTVKRIPRLGNARPPPAQRLKLYGLYKQATENDVEGIMDRPTGKGEEIRSEQAKWDAWHSQRGLSKTEAKRQYISTLIDTMHRYATQTNDSRELISELEFVWSQIREKNSSSSPSHSHSNSASYPSYQPHEESSHSSNPIYPQMSEQGARNPKRDLKSDARLRMLDPSQADDRLEPEQEDFVDAPDSQFDVQEQQSELTSEDISPSDPQMEDRQQGAVSAIIGPIARYLTMQKQETQKLEDTTSKWQRRIESALIKMNAEIAALREQIEMQRSGYSSFIHPFRKKNQTWLAWISDSLTSLAGLALKHILIDAAVLAVLIAVMHYRGVPVEKLEELILSWVRSIQQLRILQRFKRIQIDSVGQGRRLAKSIDKSLHLSSLRSRR